MSTNKLKTWWFGIVLAVSLMVPVPPVHAAELTVSQYVSLTVARLELARRTWTDEERSPVETEEAVLFEAQGTTSRAYYRYAGEHGKEIQRYLEEHTDQRDRIEALSLEIARLIEQAEVEP